MAFCIYPMSQISAFNRIENFTHMPKAVERKIFYFRSSIRLFTLCEINVVQGRKLTVRGLFVKYTNLRSAFPKSSRTNQFKVFSIKLFRSSWVISNFFSDNFLNSTNKVSIELSPISKPNSRHFCSKPHLPECLPNTKSEP